MTIVWNRPEARWLPSRHRYALMRLVAFVMLRRAAGRTAVDERIAVAIDRDQSQLEHYAFALWIATTVTLYLAAILPGVTKVLAPFLMPLALQCVLYASGLVIAPLLRKLLGIEAENQQRINSWSILLAVTLASSYVAAAATWVRYVAWFYFAVVLVNALAYLVMLLLARRVRALEAACVA